MNFPKISVVTISFNQDQYLEQTIKSVLNQNYPNIEYIIIDGGSTDNSVEIIKKYQQHLSYWVSEKDNGPANALNKGLEKCTGDYFYYINSDDVLMPNVFQKVITFINNNPNYDFYYGHGYVTNGTDDQKFPVYSMRWNLNFYRLGFISIFQQSTFIKLYKVKCIGGFNEANRTHWDGELLVDLALANATFKRFNIHTAIFRIYDTSISGDKNKSLYFIDRERVALKIDQNIGFKYLPKYIIYFMQVITDPIITFKRFLKKIRD